MVQAVLGLPLMHDGFLESTPHALTDSGIIGTAGMQAYKAGQSFAQHGSMHLGDVTGALCRHHLLAWGLLGCLHGRHECAMPVALAWCGSSNASAMA